MNVVKDFTRLLSSFCERFGTRTTLLLLCFTVSACTGLVRPNFSQELSELRPGEYTLDPEHAYVNFKVGHLGLSKIVGRFNKIAGSLDFNPNAIKDLKLQGIIEASSVDVNNDDLESTLTEAAWFDVEAYPQVTFTSKSVEKNADESLSISGELTVRGVTRTIVLSTRFNGGADNILTGKYTLGFSASTQIKRSEFGMDAFAALVGDDIEIELHGEFQRN